MNTFLKLLLPGLSNVLVMLQEATGGDAKVDKNIAYLAYSVVYWQDELRELADKSESEYDDLFFDELIEAATQISA